MTDKFEQAFWITYGTQYISGEWAWRLPFLLQMIPGLFLGIGILFLPFSPRWLASKGREDDALEALGRLRRLPTTDSRIQREWYDIRAEAAFHQETSAIRHPRLQDGSASSRFKLEMVSWLDCVKRGCWRRTHVGVGLMFFQQFVGRIRVFGECSRGSVTDKACCRDQRTDILLANPF